MLEKILASRLERKMGVGRTAPCLIVCESDGEADDVEVVTKFSAGCEEKEKHLIREAFSAMLAADLSLPVPEPYLVEIDDDFLESIKDSDVYRKIYESNRIAFGSKRLPNGFSAWVKDGNVPESLVDCAAEILLFDQIVVNSDRKPENPNCHFNGKQFAIFDHELTFMQSQILFWKEPWAEGGMDGVADGNGHIFARPHLSKKPKTLDRFVSAWKELPFDRFDDYALALPAQWGGYDDYISMTIKHLIDARENIDEIVKMGLERLS